MSDKIIVPTLGESVTEATVSKWLKNQGEKVSADEPIVELETDKVNVEVPAPSNGVLEKINVNEGETVNVGSLLGTINGSSKETLENAKEIKKYSPPKKQVQKKKKVDERPQIFDQEPLKLEDEPLQLEKEKLDVEDEKTLILDNLLESDKKEEIKEEKLKKNIFLQQLEKWRLKQILILIKFKAPENMVLS